MPYITIPNPVKAQRVENEVPKLPGQFRYYLDENHLPYGLIYRCPCGCSSVGGLMFPNAQNHTGPIWHWNGDLENPTVTPSIDHIGHWHGFLKEGFFVQA